MRLCQAYGLFLLALAGCAPADPPPLLTPDGGATLDGSVLRGDGGVRTAPMVDAAITGPEICGNGLDDDRNGVADDNCGCIAGTMQACHIGSPALANIGICRAGMQTCMATGAEFGQWMPCQGAVGPAPAEMCGNALDDDCNGVADDGACGCMTGAMQPCYSGPPGTRMIGACRDGVQTCNGTAFGACTGEVLPAAAEVCNNGIDDNCNGQAEEGCPVAVEVAVSLSGDCLTASCPASSPYPVGCAIYMEGDDTRGCVASHPTNPTVYFKEGDQCPFFGIGGGNVTGTLRCSSVPGTGLNATNCPINKPHAIYPVDSSGCPG